jgi:ATP-dependent Clp protease ATP-binding subunit ClpA
VLEFALQEAFDFGHGHVGTEHLLVGLLREQGIAANALAAAGIDLGAVTKQLPARGPAAEAAGLERSPFSRFTDRSRQAMDLARVHSLRLNHDYIDTGHMLLGLLDEGSGVAADVLKALRVDPEVIRSGVQRLVSPGPARVTQKQLPFTPAAKRALEFTLEEARGLGHDYLGTEHLLLGLIRERKGSAARVLASLGVSYEDARRTVVELLGPPGPPV